MLLAPSRLKQLHQVPGRISQKNLRAAGSGHDVIAELHAGGTQSRDLAWKIIHNKMDTRLQPPASGRAPSGIGRPGELVGPLSNRRSDPSVTSANAGAAFERTAKPRCFVYHAIAAPTSSI